MSPPITVLIIITAIVIEVIKISAFWHLNGWRGYKYKTKNKYKYDHKYIYQYKDKYRYLWLPNGPASWLAACLQLAQLAAAAPPGYVTTTQGLRQIEMQNAKNLSSENASIWQNSKGTIENANCKI